MISINEASEKISIPVSLWAGRCYEIVSLFVQKGIFTGVKRYGHYLGPVHSRSRFFETMQRAGFVRHGWIEQGVDRIIDPTRWVFECVEPYIFVGKNKGDYDCGGDKLRESLLTPPPPFCPGGSDSRWDRPIKIDFGKDKRFVDSLLGADPIRLPGIYSQGQIFWLANLPRSLLKEHLTGIFWVLIKNHFKAFIPIDNLDFMKEKKVSRNDSAPRKSLV